MKLWMQEESNDLMEKAALICLEKEGIVASDTEDIAVSVSFVSQEEMRELNSRFRDVDSVTDVLSFPMMNGADEIADAVTASKGRDPADVTCGVIPIGDVVICKDQIKRQAEEYGHSETRELIYLFVHSMLHLLGYDHMDEEEKAAMRAREEEIMEEMGLTR